MTISTTPGAVIGSETDVLPPKRSIALVDAPRALAEADEIRGMIHRITDLAIDVTGAGRYVADADFHGHTCEFSVSTLPPGETYGGTRQYRNRLYLDWIADPEIHASHGKSATQAEAEARATLTDMITHLEALLAEGPADTQEGLS